MGKKYSKHLIFDF